MNIRFALPFVAVVALTACSHKYYPEMYQVVEQEANVVLQHPVDSTLLTPPIEADQAIPGLSADTVAAPADTVAVPADTVAAPADTVAAPADTVAVPVDTVPALAPADTLAAVPADTLAAAPADTVAAAVATEKIRETQETYTSEGVTVKDAYHVVVGSFKSQVNAQNLSLSLQSQGYMARVAVNQNGLFRVFAYSTDNEPDVRKALALIRTNYPDAWMLKIAQ